MIVKLLKSLQQIYKYGKLVKTLRFTRKFMKVQNKIFIFSKRHVQNQNNFTFVIKKWNIFLKKKTIL